MKKALFVMDMQNVCVGEEHDTWFQYENHSLLHAVNQVILDNTDNTIVYTQNIMKKILSTILLLFRHIRGAKK